MANCIYSVPDKDGSGDNLYGPRTCWQPFITYAWTVHGFNKSYWGDGWGYDDCCNTDKPLARAFNAIWLLNYSAEDYDNEDWSNNILHWGRRYVREQMHSVNDLRAQCGDGSANAGSQVTAACKEYRDQGYNACARWDRNCCDWWPCSWACKLITWLCVAWYWISHWFCVVYQTVVNSVELYLPFFYTQDVPSRAGTLVHESRHIAGRAHDAYFRRGSSFGAGKWGADSSWEYQGAWMYDALYLWWFYADGRRTTPALREAAKQRANVLIDNAFTTPPGFTIS
jgi:hypothetical protein